MGNWPKDKTQTLTRRFEKKDGSLHTIVMLKQSWINGNSDGHFSATGEQIGIGGCIHGVLLKVWPECKIIVDLHLASCTTGEPMYAVENGRHWAYGFCLRDLCINSDSTCLDQCSFGGYKPDRPDYYDAKTEEEVLAILKDHLRVKNLEFLRTKLQMMRQAAERLAADDNYVVPKMRHRGKEIENVVHYKMSVRGHFDTLFTQFVKEMRPRWREECKAALEWMAQQDNGLTMRPDPSGEGWVRA